MADNVLGRDWPFPANDPNGTIGNTYGTAWEPFARGDIHLGLPNYPRTAFTERAYREPEVRPGNPMTAAAYQDAFNILNRSPLNVLGSPHGIGVYDNIDNTTLDRNNRWLGIYDYQSGSGEAVISVNKWAPTGNVLAHELTHKSLHKLSDAMQGQSSAPWLRTRMGLSGEHVDHALLNQANRDLKVYDQTAVPDFTGKPHWNDVPTNIARITGNAPAPNQADAVGDLIRHMRGNGMLPGRPMGPR